MDNLIGKTISHYKIFEKLGEGGMGVVYKAEDTKLDRLVALKFLPTHLTEDEASRKRFIVEARAASALDHPNICNIHEINETPDGQLYICMAYYGGESLSQKIKKGLIPFDGAVNIIVQIAKGLKAAHEEKIIHRDIKPGNILITDKGGAKIVDFGLAKLAGVDLTKSTSSKGTAAYMCPEQIRGQKVGRRCDIWALGIVFYEMLTGHLPFEGEYPEPMMYAIVNEEPKSLSHYLKDVPQLLQTIIDKLLKKNPDERYQNISAMLLNLEFLVKETGSVLIKTKPTIPRPFSPKKAYLYGIFAILMVMLFLVINRLYLFPDRDKINSIAVLPFENFSKDTEKEYFTDGMTDALITELSKISALRVISRTSVMQYKKVQKPLFEIANELDVDAVIEGSVLREGSIVRINAKLIQIAPEKLLWAADNERDIRDILTLQKEVARAITNEIRIALTPLEEANLARIKTVNPEAFELYLQGRYLVYNYWTPEALHKSVNYFLEALEKDANYAQAYAGLADAYTILGNWAILPPNETFPKAKTYATKALEIDENLAEAHAALGYVKMSYDWDWVGAEKAIKRAIKLNPGYSNAYGVYSWYLSVMGRFDESIEIEKKTIDLNPLSVVEKTLLGQRFYVARRYDDAILQLKKTLDANPDYYDAHTNLGWVYEHKKMYVKAIEEFQKAVELSGRMTTCIASLGHAYAIAGKTKEANRILGELKELSGKQYVSSYDIAVIYTGLGDFNKAISWFEKAIEQRDGWVGGWINIDPRLSILHSDTRFVELLNTIGFKK